MFTFLSAPAAITRFFGTFAENPAQAYDFSVEADLLVYSNISFDIHFPPGTPLSANGDFGSIGVGIINSSYGYQNFASPTVPASATNGWAHISVNVDKTQDHLAGVPGIVLDKNNYGGYPHVPIDFWVDNVTANAPPAPPPPPPTIGRPIPAVAGLNCFAAVAGSSGQNDRYHISTVADTGYGFNDQTNVTYSWNILSFPTNSSFGFQQHFFIVGGQPGQYDQAADYNLANCIFITVQATGATNGSGGVMNFRYKTNEPGGNGMLFNSTDGNNHVTYPTNGGPMMPVCSVTAPSVVGTWSVTFNNTTNVTLAGPGGVSTNFVFDPVSAALFADPATLLLGAQPNSASANGQGVVYSSFSVTGNDNPFTDNFLTDTVLNTNYWTKSEANDTNGVVLVPGSAAFWLPWSLPDVNFSLETSSNLVSHKWKDLSTVGTVKANGQREALIDTANLASPKASYFALVKRTFTQLIVLLPGQTLTPGVAPGVTGTPTPADTVNPITVTVYAEDPNFFPVSGPSDMIDLTSSDGNALLPNDAPLNNGVATFTSAVKFGTGGGGTQTITATDTTDPTKTGVNNTSSPIVVN